MQITKVKKQHGKIPMSYHNMKNTGYKTDRWLFLYLELCLWCGVDKEY